MNRNINYLGIAVDLAGCPNRCRHCWLGAKKNGNMSTQEFIAIAEEFQNWRNEDGNGISELSFFSWWREPDYRNDYRELWELEQKLSSPGRAQRYELLSTWRLARDESYAKWAATLPPKACQITFFGMEENTDWGMRRKGGFADQLKATEALIKVGISPRWQLFLTKRCLNELDTFYQLIRDLKLHERCRNFGGKFEFFIGGISPEGSGFELEDLRLEQEDLQYIPKELASISRDGLRMIGQPENNLLNDLLHDHNPPNISVNPPTLYIDADYNVYPNLAEPTEWWKLGSLKTDGVNRIMKTYLDAATPAMIANKTIPLSDLARWYGKPESKKLCDKYDLICRFMHQWGIDYMQNKPII